MRAPISLPDTLALLGVEEVKKNLWKCPVCGHRSLKVKDDTVYYCFFCQEGGGAVRLASSVWGLDVGEAATRLRERLGLPAEDEDDADTLLGMCEDLEAPAEVVAGDSRELLRHIVDEWWAGTCAFCRRFKPYVDPDRMFAAKMDRIDEGKITTVADAAREAMAVARFVEARLKVRRPKLFETIFPSTLTLPAVLDMKRKVDRSRKQLVKIIAAKYPNAPIEKVFSLLVKHDLTMEAKLWRTKS